jgi:hypothetical protein
MEKKANNPFNNLTRDEFYKNYIKEDSPLSNFVNLIKNHRPTLSRPLNILIGANNLNESDYNRFINSPFSLFIDIMNLNNDKKEKDYSIEVYDKQYDMYTLFSNNMEEMTEVFTRNGILVDNYYVDMMTAYFLPKDDYMELIKNTLKPGGKFIFEHSEHYAYNYFFKNGVLVDLQGKPLTEEKLGYFNINNHTKEIEIINTNIFDDFDELAPSFPIKINYKDGHELKYYQYNLYEAYRNYLANKYPLFNVELKTYKYSDYTYPIPINIIHEPLIIFTFEHIMTPDEKRIYVTGRKMSENKIDEFVDRLLDNGKLKEKLSNLIISPSERNVATFRENLLKAFNKILYYYELTMRGNILNEGANYQGANYQGANYQGANYQGANYQGANYQGANYQGLNYQVKYLKYKNKYLQLKNHKN